MVGTGACAAMSQGMASATSSNKTARGADRVDDDGLTADESSLPKRAFGIGQPPEYCAIESRLPSGSLNHATRAPAGDCHTPRASCVSHG